MISIPILMYHSISSVSSPAFRPFTVTADAFEAQLAYLCEHGYQTLTVSQFVTQRDDLQPGSKPVVLTFDDGFEDFHSAALPLLERYGCTATLYITTGEVGGTSRWLAGSGEGERRMLNWSQIAEIADRGIEIGGHTHTHPALDMLSSQRAREEIHRPKQMLEDRLQRAITSFAYPFGYYSGSARQLVCEAGYSSACAVRYAMSSPRDDVFALARHIVRRDATIEQFAATLNGRPPSLIYDRARSSVWKIVRRFLRGLQK